MAQLEHTFSKNLVKMAQNLQKITIFHQNLPKTINFGQNTL